MAGIDADINPEDRSELVSLMEPLLITDGSRYRGPLTDLAFDLTQKSAGFRRSLRRSRRFSEQCCRAVPTATCALSRHPMDMCYGISILPRNGLR